MNRQNIDPAKDVALEAVREKSKELALEVAKVQATVIPELGRFNTFITVDDAEGHKRGMRVFVQFLD